MVSALGAAASSAAISAAVAQLNDPSFQAACADAGKSILTNGLSFTKAFKGGHWPSGNGDLVWKGDWMTEAAADEKIKHWIAENPALHIVEKAWWFNPNIFKPGCNYSVFLWKAREDCIMTFGSGAGEHVIVYDPHFIWAKYVPK